MSVVWAEHDGNRIEQLLGVMLCREHPHANRIRPSRGDGGIDVLVPVGGDRHDVYQVKGFTRSLTSGQKRQVKDSLDRVAGNEQIEVRDWYLAVPVNPTQEGLDWFRDLTAPYDFDCHWFGLDQCDGLAAEYPEVVRYYLGDGEYRLQQAISDMRQMARLTNPIEGEQVAVPADLHGPLFAAIDAVNTDDPHFRWAFMVDTYVPFGIENPPPTPPNGFPVAAVYTAQVADDVFVTWLIYPRYAQAVDDRPITTMFTVPTNEDGTPLDQAAANWATYGIGGEFEVSDMSTDLPGGLGTASATGYIRVVPLPQPGTGDGTYDLRIALGPETGPPLAELTFKMQPVSIGIGDQPGSRAHGVGRGGIATVEMRSHGDNRHSITFGRRNMTGTQPAQIFDDVRFLHALGIPGSQMRVGPPYGPLIDSGLSIPAGSNMIDDDLLRFIEALADVQRELCGNLRMPDLDTDLTEESVNAIRTASTLLHGRGVVRPYIEQPLATTPERQPSLLTGDDEPVRVETVGTWREEAFGCLIEIDDVAMVLVSATIRPTEDNETVIARPFSDDDNRMYLWKSVDGALPHHVSGPSETDEGSSATQ